MPTAIVPPVRDPLAPPASSFSRTFWASTLGVGLLLLFGGLLWWFIGGSAARFEDVDAQRAKERYKIYNDVKQADVKALNDPAGWVNKEKGTVRLPLEQAMRLTLEELKSSQPRPAYPIAQSNPAPNPAPPADPKVNAAAGQPPTAASANNPVLTKQPDAAASSTPGAAPSPAPTPPEGGATPPPTR